MKENNLQKSFRANQKTLENWEKIAEYYKRKSNVSDLTETYIFSQVLEDFLKQVVQQKHNGFFTKFLEIFKNKKEKEPKTA